MSEIKQNIALEIGQTFELKEGNILRPEIDIYDFNAIKGYGDNEVLISGSVLSKYESVQMLGFARVVIAESGYVESTYHYRALNMLGRANVENFGSIVGEVRFDAAGSSIKNYGTIVGTWYGLGVSSYAHDSSVINSGVITTELSDSGNSGISGIIVDYKSFQNTETVSIINSGGIFGRDFGIWGNGSHANVIVDNLGTIRGSLYSYISDGFAYDRISNSGIFEGDVKLGGGNDMYEATSSGVTIGKVSGGSGNDTLSGGNSSDLFHGDDGNDKISGSAGEDSLFGGAGHDTLIGGTQNDYLNGGDGSDWAIFFGSKNAIIDLSAPGGQITGAGVDTLVSIENLATGGGQDLLFGNVAANVLDGGLGADTLLGGAGNDRYVVDNAGDQVFETAAMTGNTDAGGIDTVQSSVTFSLDTGAGVRFVENLVLTGTGAINGTGNSLANSLTGNAGNNVLDGGLGADTLLGGAGNDRYVVDNAGDQVFETAAMTGNTDAGGIDTVQSAVTFSLDTGAGVRFVENLVLTGTGAINGTGNSLANSLTGNAGNNVLDGGLGADTLLGGAGNDTAIFGAAFGSATVAEGDGVVTVTIGADINTLMDIEFLAFNDQILSLVEALGAGLLMIGTDGNDTLVGGGNDDTISGAAGDDSLIGVGGNDILAGADGADAIEGGFGNDLIGGGTGNDVISGGDGNDTIGAGQGDDTADGGAGNDIVNGGAGDDSLSGGSGNDTIGASFGNDVVVGGDDNDEIGGGAGFDLIEGGSGDDRIGGGEGSDIVNGGLGNDFLAGGGRNDVINGGSGNDTINGGDGDDTMTGGDGTDVFVFNFFKDGDNDIITDFEDGVDRFLIRIVSTKTSEPNIDNGGNGVQGFLDAFSITDTAWGALMNIDGHTILVENAAAADLTLDVFIFL